MFAIITCLEQHDSRQLVWAVLICVMSVCAGLSAYRRARVTEGSFRLAWLALLAVLLGAGVWATHFMSMLAFRKNMVAMFGLDLTLVSLLVAAAGFFSGAGVAACSSRPLGRALGGGLCGLAIAAMHFIGVSAMRLPAHFVWSPTLVVLSIVIGATASAAALVVAGEMKNLPRAISAAVLLIVAICGLHFTAMAAATLVPGPLIQQPGFYGREGLALGVGMLAGVILFCGGAVFMMDGMSKAATLGALQASLNQVPSAIGFFDRNLRLIFWNENFAELLQQYGIEARAALPYEAMVAVAAEQGLPSTLAVARSTADFQLNPSSFEPFRTPDGRWFEARSGATRDGGFVALLNDVTAQRELIEQTARAQVLAERVSRSKSEFLANTSHEIRTPLNALLGMVQVMERNDLDPEQRRRLHLVAESGHSLLAVLNSVLDLAKIEAGKFELDEHPFDLEKTVRVAVSGFEPLAAQKELGLLVEVDPDAAGVWRGDSDRLRQVLSNLVANAVKFTHQGHVLVRVTGGEAGVRFCVQDSGIGIATEKQELIFAAFEQADASTTRKFGGTGLGLAICASIVTTMGGRLAVRSAPGEGSEFGFTLALERLADEALPPAPPAMQDEGQLTLSILVAEDNPNNQLVLSALLEPFGVALTLTDDGAAAVEAFAAGGFDVVLMDVQMPRMNGMQAAAEIRRIERDRGLARVPIVALTANVMNHQVQEYLAAGMDSFIAKPIQLTELLAALASLPQRAARAVA
ncbi:ATP-binding protein [Phenylobacterium sp. LjRoot225]|uniref:ATP-binding protein n=1 Tax=Phenylobacterium sp. LjRoot225 TaxID=3342285 RepID=UPI003ECC27A1